MINWADFHFLRPLWLLLLPIALLLYFFPKGQIFSGTQWSKVIAPHLLPYLLSDGEQRKPSRFKAFFLPIFMVFLTLALAGPTVKKLPTNVSFNKTPLIIGLEVSEQMLARDIDPSRLKRAMFKLEDLLKRYQGALVALIAFAGDAHLVVPLSDDYNTVLSLAKTLTPELMPKKGVYLAHLATMVKDLVARNPKARVLIMTSTNVSDEFDTAVTSIKSMEVPVTIWAFASDVGAPIESAEGRFEHGQGGVTISKVNKIFLEKLSNINGIKTVTFTPDSRDVDTIVKHLENAPNVISKRELFFDSWYDLGPYFLAIAMAILLIGFFFARERLWIFSVMLLVSAHSVKAVSFSDWFLRRDQQAERALSEGDAKKAAELFEDDFRKGSAYYRAKMYDRAIQYLSKVNTSDGHYNLGNAYAHKGKIEEAIKSYDEALKLDPKNEDAKANKELLEKLLKDQQQKQEEKKQDQKEEQSEKPQDKTKNESQKESDDKKNNEDQQSSNDSASNKKNETPDRAEKKDESASHDKEPEEQAKKEPDIKAIPSEKNKTHDNETRHYLDPLGEDKNGFYLKRKFRYESEKRQESK